MNQEYNDLLGDNTCRIYYDENSNWVKIVNTDNNEIYGVGLEKALNDRFEGQELDYILWKIRNLSDNAYIYE